MFSKQEHCDKVMALFKPIREKAYWSVLSVVNDRDLAQDVLQEALIAAIEKFQTLRDEAKFEPWFMRISVRKAYEAVAGRKALANAQSIEDGLPMTEQTVVPDDAFSATNYKDLVVRILDWLQPETKKYLFYLRYVEDRPMEEIIQITGIKDGTLKSLYFRMRKELGALLGKEYGADD